jgi:flagellar motor switch protein FliN/FliY
MATQTPIQPAAPSAVPFGDRKAATRLLSPAGGIAGESRGNAGASEPSSRSSDPGAELVAGATRRTPAATTGSEFRTLSEANIESGEPSHGLRLSALLERMPVDVRVAIPVRDFRVQNLLALQSGELIATQWANGDDLPLLSGEVQLAWSEFEVVDTRLAVRVTRLA